MSSESWTCAGHALDRANDLATACILKLMRLQPNGTRAAPHVGHPAAERQRQRASGCWPRVRTRSVAAHAIGAIERITHIYHYYCAADAPENSDSDVSICLCWRRSATALDSDKEQKARVVCEACEARSVLTHTPMQ